MQQEPARFAAEVRLRPAVAADREFLYRVYADSRAGEMELLADWSAGQKEAFLRFQFDAQDAHYRQHYPGATLDLILHGDRPIGRLYVWRTGEEIRVMDIALLASERGLGLGTALMRDLLGEADAASKPLGLHVEPNNPAKRLYERLGFRVAGTSGYYQLMQRLPKGPDPQLKTAS
jgi:ribosomal protein S18 acetylase RimI-like enzyme